jgi:hypothetical protein
VASFTAALTAASVALRAAGYRTTTQAGHHLRTIESLALTVKAEPGLVQKLKVFSHKRNKSVYDAAGAISDQDLKDIAKLATELYRLVKQWIESSHPELLKG